MVLQISVSLRIKLILKVAMLKSFFYKTDLIQYKLKVA